MMGSKELPNPWLDNPLPKSTMQPNIKVRLRSFISFVRQMRDGEWPYRLHPDMPHRILYFEFRGYGLPPDDIGHPGDVYLDLTPSPYLLYSRLKYGGWSPWNWSIYHDSQAFRLRKHPLFENRYLWGSFSGGITWFTGETLRQRKVAIRERHDPADMINEVLDLDESEDEQDIAEGDLRRRDAEQKRRHSLKHPGVTEIHGLGVKHETTEIQLGKRRREELEVEVTSARPSMNRPRYSVHSTPDMSPNLDNQGNRSLQSSRSPSTNLDFYSSSPPAPAGARFSLPLGTTQNGDKDHYRDLVGKLIQLQGSVETRLRLHSKILNAGRKFVETQAHNATLTTNLSNEHKARMEAEEKLAVTSLQLTTAQSAVEELQKSLDFANISSEVYAGLWKTEAQDLAEMTTLRDEALASLNQSETSRLQSEKKLAALQLKLRKLLDLDPASLE